MFFYYDRSKVLKRRVEIMFRVYKEARAQQIKANQERQEIEQELIKKYKKEKK